MEIGIEIGRAYRDAHTSFTDLAVSIGDDEWSTPSPCTPGWTVRDVLSHVAGVSIDIVEGNVEGAATDPWTAAQVERWRATPTDELLARWAEAIGPAADLIERFGEVRPVFDCHTHEHDVRTALGRPGNRDHELVDAMIVAFAGPDVGRRVIVHTTSGATFDLGGAGAQLEVEGISGFELVRSRLGRRSAEQVRAWNWSEPVPGEVLAGWFAFGPSAVPIVE